MSNIDIRNLTGIGITDIDVYQTDKRKYEATEKVLEETISLAVVEFRTNKTYDGEFGFDWYHKEDNRLSGTTAYKDKIQSGYKDGSTNLNNQQARDRFLDMYEQLPIMLASRKLAKDREEKNYHVPYLSMFSKKTVENMNLPNGVIKPVFTVSLNMLIEIERPLRMLQFEFDPECFDIIISTDGKTQAGYVLPDKRPVNGKKGLQISRSQITIICKKDLDMNKEIKVFAYPEATATNIHEAPRSLAGKIIILQNDEKVRMPLNMALVNVTTNIENKSTTGQIEPDKIEMLRKGLYQCLIVPHILQGIGLDLSSNDDFKIVKNPATGQKKYGKWIFKQSPGAEGVDGAIFSIKGCYDYLKNLYIHNNKSVLVDSFYKHVSDKDAITEEFLIANIFTAFAFNENSWTGPLVLGKIKGIGQHSLMIFKFASGPDNKYVLVHEAFHGLGLYHTHIDEKTIKHPEILSTFKEHTTGNFMSYVSGDDPSVLQQAGITPEPKNYTWRWQWRIANPNIPKIKSDPEKSQTDD